MAARSRLTRATKAARCHGGVGELARAVPAAPVIEPQRGAPLGGQPPGQPRQGQGGALAFVAERIAEQDRRLAGRPAGTVEHAGKRAAP